MQAVKWFRKNTPEPRVKSETEKLLRKALEDYENKKFVAKADNLTVGELLDMWAEEELKNWDTQQRYSRKLSWCNPLYQKNTRLQTAN